MLEKYFSAPKTLRRLRGGISGSFVDAFADDLNRDGYAPTSAVRYIRAAAHLGCFVQRRGGVLADIDVNILDSFSRHLRRCRCPHFRRGKISYHAHFGVKLFHHHLVERGICKRPPVQGARFAPALVTAFCDWFRTHRGVKEPTLQHYARGATDLIRALGEDVGRWNAQAVRNFLLERASQSGTSTTQALITSLRAFMRFLSFSGECRDDLAIAIPAVAHWRLARLPRCLSAEEVDRLIAASNGTTPGRLRDRAILLMLARLGLRSGDVAALRLGDIDWNNGTLQVIGKGRYQVRLPLPQDVGDALLRYLDCRPANLATDHVFLRSNAPCRPFASGDAVSSVVKHALKRANIDTPARGAHVLRHTAATEMLRNGVPLDQAGLVLRHRSIDMTAYYAKADVALLKQIAQPWPEVKS
ncbi:MAG TPA: site-specific integrase [Bryobacteraceae bacterium]|nr:site-specific integrase [Bryobacteraceae bacterium]